MSEATETRHCRQCEKQLYGRIDQVYCNDNCRNTYNKQQTRLNKIEPHPNQKAIFKIIQRNYEILKRLYPYPISPYRYEYANKQRMPTDFEPNFFTGIQHTDNVEWFVCFDRGWRIEGDRYHLKDFPHKAEL